MDGIVLRMNDAKFFGFIKGADKKEYFFHKSDTVSDFGELVDDFYQSGEGKIKVRFDPDDTPKGPRARNVTVTES